MKTAVIYYSYQGNCALVAEAIKGEINAEVFEIKTVDTKKRKGFPLILWGVFQVMTKKKPELQPLSIDIGAFDVIILGTPVWAGAPAPAMVSFINKTEISGKKIALYCCHGGGKGDIFNKFKTLLPGNTFTGEIDFTNPAKEGRAAIKVQIGEWVKTLGT